VPGRSGAPWSIQPDEHILPRLVVGTGLFTIPHGPVRSGVTESVEFLVETPGEDIPELRVRVYAKHRGIEKRFEGMDAATGVLLAERVEGIASVAHALAFAHAVESLGGTRPPRAARLVRVVHAELERIANHLDVAMRLADAAGLAVATARLGAHKERVLRLVGRLCGSRFGRGVVVPGGVRALPALRPDQIRAELASLAGGFTPDAQLLMNTSSFIDRLRRTGVLDTDLAIDHGALGPVGRASGLADDDRIHRTYDAYDELVWRPATPWASCDARARLQIRFDEIDDACTIIDQAVAELSTLDAEALLCRPVGLADGRGIGWAEAPQGEVLYVLESSDGRIRRCRPRSASFHNLAVFSHTFNGDVLTDFAFIEASFGLSMAGVVL
jgi:Ni,Fe-hydrogenase III large subunit